MEIREIKPQATVCIKTNTAIQDLPKVLGAGYGEIMGYTQRKGLKPTGAPYALYLNDDMSNLQIEFGIPTEDAVEAEGRIEPGRLPGGRAAVALHVGPYSSIEQTYKSLTAFLQEKGLEPSGLCFESYIDDPQTTEPEKLRTEVFFPLKD